MLAVSIPVGGGLLIGEVLIEIRYLKRSGVCLMIHAEKEKYPVARQSAEQVEVELRRRGVAPRQEKTPRGWGRNRRSRVVGAVDGMGSPGGAEGAERATVP